MFYYICMLLEWECHWGREVVLITISKLVSKVKIFAIKLKTNVLSFWFMQLIFYCHYTLLQQ